MSIVPQQKARDLVPWLQNRNLCTARPFILQDHQMTVIVDIAEMRKRCPRCRASSIILSAVDIRPSFQYLTLRCNACTILFDAQVATAEGQEGSLATDRRELAPTA
jgi:hypothetical protein